MAYPAGPCVLHGGTATTAVLFEACLEACEASMFRILWFGAVWGCGAMLVHRCSFIGGVFVQEFCC